MTNYLLSKGYKYYVRLSGNRQPVLNSMVARKVPPRRSNGTWTDITSCLTGCCGVDALTAENTLISVETETGSILTLAGVVSSFGDVLTVTPITINGGTVVVDANGDFTVSATTANETVVVVVTDTHGNSLTISIIFSVTVE